MLREELELVEVPIVSIVVAYAERLAEQGDVDLESLSEFLVLVAALCELKARLLTAGEDEDEEALDPEDAAAELAERLAEYRRYKNAARWLGERREQLGRRVFRGAPAPLAPRRPPAAQPPEQPAALAAALARLLEPPEQLEVEPPRFRVVSVRPFLDRLRRALAEQGTFLFDDEIADLDGAEQAAAFLALLELYKRGELRVAQAELFAPIRVARSAGLLVRGTPIEASAARRWRERRARPHRRGAALHRRRAAHDRAAGRGRRGRAGRDLVGADGAGRAPCRGLERRRGRARLRRLGAAAARDTAEACARLVARAPDRTLSPAALETLAVIAYVQPVGRPEIARIRGVAADAAVAGLLERGLIEEVGRGETTGAPVLYGTTAVFDRVFGLAEGLADLPPLPGEGEVDADDLRERLHAVAALRD